MTSGNSSSQIPKINCQFNTTSYQMLHLLQVVTDLHVRIFGYSVFKSINKITLFLYTHDLGLVNPSVNVAKSYHPSKNISSLFLASLCKLILLFIDVM